MAVPKLRRSLVQRTIKTDAVPDTPSGAVFDGPLKNWYIFWRGYRRVTYVSASFFYVRKTASRRAIVSEMRSFLIPE